MRSWRTIAVALGWLAATACAFDASAPGLGTGAPDASVGGPDRPADPVEGGDDPIDDPPSACIDDDSDGFAVVGQPDAECGELDCNDGNPNVFPGQVGAFTVPDAVMGFDYNCDGVEQKLVQEDVGGPCEAGLFSCNGTGWVDAEPDCGQVGVWHRCEAGLFSCREEERVEVLMPCN